MEDGGLSTPLHVRIALAAAACSTPMSIGDAHIERARAPGEIRDRVSALLASSASGSDQRRTTQPISLQSLRTFDLGVDGSLELAARVVNGPIVFDTLDVHRPLARDWSLGVTYSLTMADADDPGVVPTRKVGLADLITMSVVADGLLADDEF